MAGTDTRGGGEAESLAEVLASIRALVSAETESRVVGPGGQGETVLMLTPDMRLGQLDARSDEAEGGRAQVKGSAETATRTIKSRMHGGFRLEVVCGKVIVPSR